jgi:two-component system phosphate regulon response regulator PhoB
MGLHESLHQSHEPKQLTRDLAMSIHQQMTVMIVEDESDIRDLIALQLRREGYQILLAASVADALELSSSYQPDMIVLDWMLPGESGIEFARSVRSGRTRLSSATPILMLTARTDEADLIAGLDAGADDFLSKPYDQLVLLARVRALIRRAQLQLKFPSATALTTSPEPEGQLTTLRLDQLSLTVETYEVRCAGEILQLTPSEFKLLHALMLNRGRVLTRDALIGLVQGDGVSVVGRTVDTHVFGLRKKLGPCADVIETVRGVGYRVKLG